MLVGLATAGLTAQPGAAAPAPPPAADVAAQLDQANQALEVVIEQYDAIGVKIAGTQAQQAAATAALAPVRERYGALDAAFGKVACGLYVHAGGELGDLLGAGTTTTLLERLTTYDHFAFDQRSKLRALRQAETDYATQRAGLDVLVARQRNEQAALAAKRATIEAQIAALSALREHAWPRTPAVDRYVPAYQEGPAGVAVRFAYAQIGRPYQYGAAGPGGYDCSGLVMAAWRAAGVGLPHNAALMWRSVAHVSRAQLQPGDLVFYYRDIHHVALYIGEGRIVHAPTWGRDVTIAPVDEAPIYGYGRA